MPDISPLRAIAKQIFLPDPSFVLSWTLANGDVGVSEVDAAEHVEHVEYPDRSVQVAGTFGAGGTVVIQGSNDGANWATLTDQLGNPLSFTTADIATIMEVARYIRPVVTAGDGTTSISVSILFRRARF
jgi:hypothetical protein